MKQKILLSMLALLLAGVGCFSTNQEEVQDSVAGSGEWNLAFELPDGWVMVPHYQNDVAIETASALDPSLSDVVLQSTEKNIWMSAGTSPNEEQLLELGGEDSVVYDDYTYIRVVEFAPNSVIPSEAEDLGDGFFRVMLCEDGGECQLGGKSNYEYYLETDDQKYRFYINQNNQDLSVAEEVILSAEESSE